MNNRKERLLLAIGEVDEKYIKEAESKMRVSSIIKVAAVLVVVIALSLYLFVPFAPVTGDLSAYEGSSYFPLIEGIDEYRLSFMQPTYKNNFEGITAMIVNLFGGVKNLGADFAPGDSTNASGDASDPESNLNGSYVESTDNQVAGVIESDLFKMTDKYIFRLGTRHQQIDSIRGKNINVLRVYSIDKENSALVSEFDIPQFDGQQFSSNLQMYLSLDGNTVTVIEQFNDEYGNANIGAISLDVSDVNSISEKGRVSIDGSLNTTRYVNGKLLLVTEFYFNRNQVDYNDPTTFVPTIDSGNGAEAIEFEDIIFPDEVGNTRYSVVALLDEENLTLLGANALLNFTSDVYVSAENVFITREYTARTEDQDGRVNASNTSDIAVINYSGESLEKKGIITVRGWAEDQYSFDELDGYLRVVTSAVDNSYMRYDQGGTLSQWKTTENVSLYIFDLSDNSLAYSVEDFAIEGEEATAVRFDGDKLYVCTAVVVTFTDPVYFFDLSDYENIGSVDTGVIEGYSDHLINYGEGFLLGIGREDWQYSKVEIYEERDGEVVSVDEFKFEGEYSLDYKAYLVNRENDLFGFGVNYLYTYDEQTGEEEYGNRYILLQFNGYEFTVRIFEVEDMNAATIRAAYIDGYLYITTPYDLIVEKIN